MNPDVLTDDALIADGIVHGFFTRAGGVSGGIYRGLNIGLGSADAREKVHANRDRAMRSMGLPGIALNTLHQVHGAEVVTITQPLGIGDLPKGDGMATDRPGLALGIATADCAPVLFADSGAGVIGACHAGWKGAFAGVVEATVARMENLGADRARIAGALGPCIHWPSYEVGSEFRDRFLNRDPALNRFFLPSDRDARHRFDLPGFVLSLMTEAGLGTTGHVAEDTYADPVRFYSHRRAMHREECGPDGKVDYGRLLSVIALR